MSPEKPDDALGRPLQPDQQVGPEDPDWALFDRLPDPAWVFDSETLRFLAVNAATIERYGWSREEFLSLSVLDIRPAEERGRLQEVLKAFPGLHREGSVWHHRTKGGEVFPVEVSAQPISFKGRPGRLVVARDATDRVRTLEALRESEERYRSVIEQSGDMIFILDLESKRVVQSNPAFRSTLGYPDPEGSGLSLYDLVEADRESVDRNIAQVLGRGHYHVGRRKYRHADGRQLDVEVGATALRASGRPLMAAVARDVTEKLRADQALQQAQKLESLGLLAGSVAHDFNNLLTAMMGNLNLAQLKGGRESGAAPHLDDLEQTLLKAAELTRQMLAYSGRGQFVVKAVDLNQAVEEVLRALSLALPLSASISFQPGQGLPPIEADPAQLQQVLMNLVTNAAESLDGQPGMIRIATTLRSAREEAGLDFQGQPLPTGEHAVLEVGDTGCGMSAEVLARIFEPFFTTKPTGRGLGLSAMLGILRGHKAGLQIESQPGRGSTFRIHFPAGAQVPEAGSKAPAPAEAAPTGIALVVDDEEEIRQAAASLFSVLGFREVLEAGDGEAALALFRERRQDISLVFMDLTMPRLSGKDAFRAMRALKPGVLVVLTSGYTEQEAFRDFGDEAPFGFLQKPYRFKQLRQVVLEAIQRGA